MKLDWGDILLHMAVSLPASAAMLWLGLPWPVVFMAGLAFWLGRELWQHRRRPVEAFTRPQSLVEWLAPLAVAIAAIVLWRAWAPIT